MIKKEYMIPTMQVIQFMHQSHILAGSLQSVKTTGLDEEDEEEDLEYDNNGGNQGYAW
jgi:hypothetical protein